ncbi:hypothetical protein QT381_02550 [Galbitalea sp. SE-J8]|uniref:hypothetical protein n=1 Tax=Galbitalea sp. SE-J8 TaxID=3054952 RepID=UPI00259CD4BD|nr:hypothetical protein [Galbitalea sp. SE-J8]MDM4761883.1 hypothetical protein [Galbitalea sp. SE-J8]
MAGKGEGGYSIRIDPMEWAKLKADLDRFDPGLARSMRRRIKQAGMVAANRVRRELELDSPGGGADTHEGRDALIRATSVSVSFGKRMAGARVVTSDRLLDDKHKGLMKVYNLDTFRHPVFGDREEWVTQKGRPYFGAVIRKALDREVYAQIQSIFDDAYAFINARMFDR